MTTTLPSPPDHAIRGPIETSGHWVWSAGGPEVEVRFVGRGSAQDRLEILRTVVGADLELAWMRQVHSSRSLAATAGDSGEADALITGRPGLVLSAATADCLPIVVSGEGMLAVIHAGWRGLAGGIIGRTLARLGVQGDRLFAWIGPSIGPCCYEVGEEVAHRVARASASETVLPGGRERPHLDLRLAAETQLAAAGVTRFAAVETCTHCDGDRLWSYRRDGGGAGRNYAFAWLR